jgi:hypothetical protein
MTGILIYIAIFYAGVFTGYVIRTLVQSRFRDYTGTIVVSKRDHKTVYSLILDDYPERIQFEREVVFKVEASDVELDRNEN